MHTSVPSETDATANLQLMRSVTGLTWGSDLQVLRMLYTSLILSKLDYASFIYRNAAPSNLIKLNRIQYAGARIILGALKCTPTHLLEAEADLMPLALRRDQMLLQYSTRVSTIPQHPVTKLIQSYFPIQEYVTTRYTLSAIGHLHDLKQNLPPGPPPPPPIPVTHRLTNHYLPVRTTLSSLATKHSHTPSQWQAAFRHLCSTLYPMRTHVYTDGSSDGGRRGCAVWSSSFTLLSRLPESSCVFTTELYAIFSAIKFISTNPGS